jgi:hypothetical protein
METEVVKCPSCGSQDHWEDNSRRSRRMCQNCGTIFDITDRAVEKVQPAKQKAAEPKAAESAPEAKETKPQESLGELLVLWVLSIGMVACLIGGLIWMGQDTQKHAYYSGRVNTIGQYEIPPLVCPEGEQVKLEYGFNQKPPFLEVFPGVPGKDYWQITPEQADSMRANRGNDYYWVHCVNADNKPDYFMDGGYSTLPEDGQEVVFKKED